MPITVVNESELPPIERASRLDHTQDLQDLRATLKEASLAQGKAIRFTLSKEILDLYGKDKAVSQKKALAALRQKLKLAYPQYLIRTVKGEILIVNKKKKHEK